MVFGCFGKEIWNLVMHTKLCSQVEIVHLEQAIQGLARAIERSRV
jgi:hypothetical protein